MHDSSDNGEIDTSGMYWWLEFVLLSLASDPSLSLSLSLSFSLSPFSPLCYVTRSLAVSCTLSPHFSVYLCSFCFAAISFFSDVYTFPLFFSLILFPISPTLSFLVCILFYAVSAICNSFLSLTFLFLFPAFFI